MVLSYSTIAANEVTALANNCPVIVPSNLLKSSPASTAGDPIWTIGGLYTSTDLTNPAKTGERLRDNSMIYPSHTSDVSTTIYYINHSLSGVEVDTVAVKLHDNPNGSTYTISVQFGDPTFTAPNTATAASWSGVTSTNRLVQSGLDYPEDSATAGTVRFSSVTAVRVKIEQTAGATQAPPPVAEVLIGRRQILSHALETGSDLSPRGAVWSSTKTAGRHEFRYVHASGFEDHEASYHFGENSTLGWDDYSTLQTIQTGCNYGADPVWAKWRTGSNWVLGFFGEPLNFPIRRGEWTDRNWSFTFMEQPPFAARES